MRIALFCPFTQGPTRGNITSVQRIARYLQMSGQQVEMIPLDSPDRLFRLQLLTSSPPDVLHGFHAFHAGPLTRTTAQQLGIPYAITLTGSDLFDPVLRDHPETRSVIRDAAAVICFDTLVAELAAQIFPRTAKKLTIIPQGVEPFRDATPLEKPTGSFIILLPAALRPVKGIDFAIEQLASLIAEQPRLQLWIAGGTLDYDYAAAIHAQAKELPWVRLLGEVSHEKMGRLYATADLVLNSSQFEGGMANALLEAMAMGKPVLARDVSGNRSLIQHNKTGWSFKNGQELCDLIRQLAADQTLRETVARQGQQHILTHYSPQQEVTLLEQMYRSLTSVPTLLS